jgi:Double zinc ribbon
MALTNYRDIGSYGGSSPGFQFEFTCSNCANTWRSAFKPYRKGQVAGFISNLLMHVHGVRNVAYATRTASEAGMSGAKKTAFDEAMEQARSMYTECSECQQAACGKCCPAGQRLCKNCLDRAGTPPRGMSGGAQRGEAAAATSAMSCPNCRTAHAGGRFCADCGFDMASTHKSCPDCGAMALRQARFCNDCGHGF